MINNRRCFFILEKRDLDPYLNIIEDKDIILSTSLIPDLMKFKNNYIYLDNILLEDKSKLDEFLLFFKSYFNFDKDAWAFSNNFYETCYEYTLKIEYLIKNYNITTIFYPKKTCVFTIFGFQKLVGAEYETQNRFLYDRGATFLYILKKLEAGKNIKFIYTKRNRVNFNFIHNAMRLVLLFLLEIFRFFKSINKGSLGSNTSEECERIYLFRSTEAYKFTKFREKANFCELNYFNSISSKKLNSIAKYKAKFRPRITDFVKTFILVLKNILIILFKKAINNGINYKQAFLEIQIMSMQPRIYYLTLIRTFHKLEAVKVIYNFEAKTPYAYFDKKVADFYQKKLITILSFDLMKKHLPEHFFANTMHVSSKTLKNELKEVVSKKKSIISIYNMHAANSINILKEYKYKYCLFLGVFNYESNLKLIEFFKNNNYNFCIKKHPRDNFNYPQNFDKFFLNYNISDNQLFNIFKIGITGASGIVEKLIANKKTFYLLLDYGFGLTKSLHYYNKNYLGNINTIYEIKKNLDETMLSKSFEKIYVEKIEKFDLNDFYNKIELV